jgi:hypothetical protein
VALYVGEEVVAAGLGDRLYRADDVPAEGMLRPHDGFEQAVDVVLGLVQVHLQLLEDDHPLPLHVGRGELRVGHDVEEDVDRELEAVGRDPGPVDGELLVGRGVHDTADALDRLGDLLRGRTPSRALEEQVLDEVRDASDPVLLEAGAHPEHHDEGG